MEIVHARVRGRAVGKGLVYASTSLAAYPTAGKKPKRCSLRLASSASQGEGQTARISITDDGSTHPLAERLKPEPFRTQKEGAVLGILAERVGTNEVSSRWWVRHLQDARNVLS